MKNTLLLVLLLTSSVYSFSKEGFFVDSTAIDQRIKEVLEYHTAPGFSISIISKDGTMFNRAYGTLANSNDLLSESLYIGSVSKVITTLAISKLLDTNILSDNEKVTKYISTVDESINGILDDITIRDLLHHHSGISKQFGYNDLLEYHGQINELKMSTIPGTNGEYSSANQVLLGLIIEKVTGRSYKDYVEKELFEPLGMVNSFVPNHDDSKIHKGYCFWFGVPLPSAQMKYGKYIIPAGYIMSTSEDLNRMNLMLINHGQLDSIQFLKPETVRKIFTPFSGGEFGYGMGWGIGTVNGIKAYTHEGMTKISYAYTAIIPDQEISISIITNINAGPFYSVTNKIIEDVIKINLNQTLDHPFPIEMVIRILFGVLFLKMIYDILYVLYKWKSTYYYLTPDVSIKSAFQFIKDIVPLLVLIFLPVLIKVPASMMVRIMPDIGYALYFGGIISIPTAVVNNFRLAYLKSINAQPIHQ